MTDFADPFTPVLGAYALDAVDPDERDEIEQHLRECPRCRAEVVEHQGVAALLSQAGAPAPEGVWDRIVAELSPPAPPLRMSFSLTGEVDPLADRAPGGYQHARRVRLRTFVAAIAAALLVVAALGAVVVSQNRNLNRQVAAAKAPPGIQNAALSVHMKGLVGEAQAFVQDTGRGFLVPDKLRSAADGNVYQLWGNVDGHVLSLGTFSSKASPVQFQLHPSQIKMVKAFMVTEEKAPGVASTNNPPLISGTV